MPLVGNTSLRPVSNTKLARPLFWISGQSVVGWPLGTLTCGENEQEHELNEQGMSSIKNEKEFSLIELLIRELWNGQQVVLFERSLCRVSAGWFGNWRVGHCGASGGSLAEFTGCADPITAGVGQQSPA